MDEQVATVRDLRLIVEEYCGSVIAMVEGGFKATNLELGSESMDSIERKWRQLEGHVKKALELEAAILEIVYEPASEED